MKGKKVTFIVVAAWTVLFVVDLDCGRHENRLDVGVAVKVLLVDVVGVYVAAALEGSCVDSRLVVAAPASALKSLASQQKQKCLGLFVLILNYAIPRVEAGPS